VKTQRAQRFPARAFVDTRRRPGLAFQAFGPSHSGVAQLVEQVTVNHRVAGSSPAAGVVISAIRDTPYCTLAAIVLSTIHRESGFLVEVTRTQLMAEQRLDEVTVVAP
jgi:hypothetical protein